MGSEMCIRDSGITLKHTRLGLAIRSTGENPHAAQALGFPVFLIRYSCVAFGGLLAGFAGAYASTIYTPLWADGMIAGRGWIAVALVVFGTWKTGRIAFGALLFGMVSLGELIAQSMGANIPSQLLSSCLLYTSPSPRDLSTSRMPSSA